MRIFTTLATTSVVAALALTGCSMDSGNESKPVASSAGCDGASVAYITSATSVSFWRSLSLGIKDAASDKNIKVTDYDSDNSQSKQLQNAQDAITSGVDLIILSPTDSASAPAVLEAAKNAQIPVVIADIGTESGEYATLIKTNNVAAAETAGEYLVEQLKAEGHKNGEVAIIGISQTRQNGKDRTNGFTEQIENAGFKVVQLLESADYTRSEGLGFTQDLIAGNPNLIGLFTEHDEATQGALTALDGAVEPTLVGFDGSPDTLQAIKDGTLAGAVMQQPVLMGQEALKAACGILDGESVSKEVMVDTILVTKENVLDIEDEVQNTVFKE